MACEDIERFTGARSGCFGRKTCTATASSSRSDELADIVGVSAAPVLVRQGKQGIAEWFCQADNSTFSPFRNV
jgi:hypothetical protein